MKGGDCGCNANHAIGPMMGGGSGFLNPATYTSGSLPDNSYYQYNQAVGTSSDPNTTGPGGNLVSARNLDNMTSTGGGKKRSRRIKKSKKNRGSRKNKNPKKKGGARKKGGNLATANEVINNKMSDYMTSSLKGGSAHNYSDVKSLDYVTDKAPYIPNYTKGGRINRKSRKMSGGNLSYSLFNQLTNPVVSFGTTMGATNNASIASGHGQMGDSGIYNQPAAGYSGYSSINPYLI